MLVLEVVPSLSCSLPLSRLMSTSCLRLVIFEEARSASLRLLVWARGQEVKEGRACWSAAKSMIKPCETGAVAATTSTFAVWQCLQQRWLPLQKLQHFNRSCSVTGLASRRVLHGRKGQEIPRFSEHACIYVLRNMCTLVSGLYHNVIR